MLQCPLLGLSGSCTFTSPGAQQRGSGDCFGVSRLCYDHSPRATKADHLLLPETTLSLVCTGPGRGLGSPSYPALSPGLALLHRWASVKGNPSLSGFVKESGYSFLALMISSHLLQLHKGCLLSAQGQAQGGTMAVACPTFWGSIRQGREN